MDIDHRIQWTKTVLANLESEISQLKAVYNIYDVSLLRKRDDLAEVLARLVRIRSMLNDQSRHSA